MQEIARIDAAANVLRERISDMPTIGLILGSGLGDFVERLQDIVKVPYASIPGFPVSTVPGHKGRWVAGYAGSARVLCMQGRFHFYEGWAPQDIVLPVRVMARLGIRTLMITNAAGGINTGYAPGNLMLLADHINFSGVSPLSGPNIEELGPRFPDMSRAYDVGLRVIARDAASRNGIVLHEGIYAMMPGPSFETPAEIRMLRAMGADAVGMSTVPEVVAARHAGMRVLGISCITNCAAGILDQPLSHMEVLETGKRVQDDMAKLILELTRGIHKEA